MSDQHPDAGADEAPAECYALIDEAKVLIGFSSTPTEDPAQCRKVPPTLKQEWAGDIGKYRLVGEGDREAWQPIEGAWMKRGTLSLADLSIKAFALGFASLRDQGVTLDPYTLQWLARWEKTQKTAGDLAADRRKPRPGR